MKSFESWLFDEVEKTFQIKRNFKSETLNNWLAVNIEPNERQREALKLLQELILEDINTFNEDELKMQFIGPILSIVNFKTEKFKAFSQRTLSLKTDKVETSGIVDYMLATGKSKPEDPFFFLHEYKQQHPSKKNDPIGQLLIAMIAAQAKNNNNQIVYGVLVEGRFWYFLVLQNKEYAVSNALDATTEEIFKVYSTLCKVKEYIMEIIND